MEYEYIDLYDKNRIPTGMAVQRGSKLPEETYRIVVHVCIFNSKGEMLIQQRQSTKTVFPDMWDISAGGQVESGETSEMAAQREVYEELGLYIHLANKRPAATMNFDEGFDDIYIVKRDTDISELTIQQDEVKDVGWADKEKILSMIADGKFIPYYTEYIAWLFSAVSQDGTFWNESKTK